MRQRQISFNIIVIDCRTQTCQACSKYLSKTALLNDFFYSPSNQPNRWCDTCHPYLHQANTQAQHGKYVLRSLACSTSLHVSSQLPSPVSKISAQIQSRDRSQSSCCVFCRPATHPASLDPSRGSSRLRPRDCPRAQSSPAMTSAQLPVKPPVAPASTCIHTQPSNLLYHTHLQSSGTKRGRSIYPPTHGSGGSLHLLPDMNQYERLVLCQNPREHQSDMSRKDAKSTA